MSVLLYEIYGPDRRYHLELTYSILSAFQYLKDDPAGIRIVLIADPDNRRPDLPVENVTVSHDTIRDWQMGGKFNHAIQYYCLHHALETFRHTTVLVDGDTVFKAHPKHLFERVSPGRVLLNAKEDTLENISEEWPKYQEIIAETAGDLCGFPIGKDTTMFNTGVMGLHPQDAPHLLTIVEMMRQVRAINDVFTAGQLAASILFDRNTTISTCEDILEHYWGPQRGFYHYQINRMFPEILRGGGIETSTDAPLEPLKPMPGGAPLLKLAAEAKRRLRRAPKEYRDAYLAYLSALFLRRRDPELANVWAMRAVNVLAWGARMAPQDAGKDFKSFALPQLNETTWLQPDVRQRWRQYWTGEFGPRR